MRLVLEFVDYSDEGTTEHIYVVENPQSRNLVHGLCGGMNAMLEEPRVSPHTILADFSAAAMTTFFADTASCNASTRQER